MPQSKNIKTALVLLLLLLSVVVFTVLWSDASPPANTRDTPAANTPADHLPLPNKGSGENPVNTTQEAKAHPYLRDLNQPVYFVDPVLEGIIRSEIPLPMGDITVKHVLGIHTLDASHADINRLDGLEYLYMLRRLDLGSNRIDSIDSLSGLFNLEHLTLSDNHIEDLSPLQGLVNLKELNLRDNMVVDLFPLTYLRGLEKLNLRGNRIEDIGSLRVLIALTDLNLRNNRIKDVSPLEHLPALTDRLYLNGNSIRDYSMLIPAYDRIAKKDFYVETFTGIPEIHIDTNHRSIASRDVRVEAQMIIQNSPTSDYPEAGLYAGNIGIRGRGNSSWGGDKNPYNFELWDENGASFDSMILDLAAEEDWLLIPNHFDKSLMRNAITLMLADRLGMPYTPQARYVELFLNNRYQGNYLLVERIKRDKNRVGIKPLTDQDRDQVEPRITGGYILRIDRTAGNVYFNTKVQGQPILFHYPRPENLTAAQRRYITDYINELEAVLYGNNFKDPVDGWQKYIDVDSFVDWYLIHELSNDVDTWRFSTFMYKDRGEKLSLGPVWDFDITYGNANYNNAWKSEGTNAGFYQDHSWFSRLLQDPYFKERLAARWQEVKPLMDELPVLVNQTASFLEDSADRNFERYPILGRYIWPNVAPYPTTYQGEVERLKEWIIRRTAWMDEEMTRLQDELLFQ